MVDIFPQLYREAKAIVKSFVESANGVQLFGKTKVKVSNAYLYSSQEFPCVTIEELDNSNAEGETDLAEKRSQLMYEVNIYDKSPQKMERCRKLASVLDGYFSGKIGFNRTLSEPFPNEADSTIYRHLMRFEGYIDNETGIVSRK